MTFVPAFIFLIKQAIIASYIELRQRADDWKRQDSKFELRGSRARG